MTISDKPSHMNSDRNTGQVFIYDNLCVFFKHTDEHGFLHPYNFLEWTSYVREAFFRQNVPTFADILKQPIKMMTSKISSQFHSDSVFGDMLEARFTVARTKKFSFDVIIRFFNRRTEKVVCETIHTLVFVNEETQKFDYIPPDLKNVTVNYEENVA